ncbi:glycine zipper domain-containing protein [Acinetobacter sp. BSP-28]|uniref:glycine zipper domain-containing protein n=1 Tax=Acinetobacter sp. BSP-28 TaxID=3344661 RepID=UPI00376FCF02
MNSEIQDPMVDSNPKQSTCAKSSFSPTLKGVLIGAVAGSVLPVFGTFSGAIIGGVAGKVYEKKCQNKCHAK